MIYLYIYFFIGFVLAVAALALAGKEEKISEIGWINIFFMEVILIVSWPCFIGLMIFKR